MTGGAGDDCAIASDDVGVNVDKCKDGGCGERLRMRVLVAATAAVFHAASHFVPPSPHSLGLLPVSIADPDTVISDPVPCV